MHEMESLLFAEKISKHIFIILI